MQIVKWQDSLAVALPADVVAELQLKEGDEIDLEVTGERRLPVRPRMTREEALEHSLPIGNGTARKPMPVDELGPLAFLDANILVYAFSDDLRSSEAKQLLSAGCVIGIQGLNEFANVARKKTPQDLAGDRGGIVGHSPRMLENRSARHRHP